MTVPRHAVVDQPSISTRTLALQYGWLLVSRLTSVVLQAITLILLARWLGPTAFGVAAAVIGVLTVAGALADLGLGPLLLRERSLNRDYPRTRQILRVNAGSSTSLALLTLLGLAVTGALTSNPLLFALMPLGVWVAAEKNGDLWLNLATAEGLTQVSAISISLRRGLGLGFFAALVIFVPAAWAFSTGLALGSVAANLAVRRFLQPTTNQLPPEGLKHLLRAAWPFYLNSVAAQARSLDVALVSILAGPTAGGIYAVPARLTSPLRMLPTTLSPIIVRYAALGTSQSLRAIKRMATMVMIIMPIMMIIVAAIAPWLISISLGASFSAAVLPLRILCVGLVFAFGVSLQTGYLQGRGEERYVGSVAVVITVLTLVSLAVGAAIGGAVGAACAASGTFVVHCGLLALRTSSSSKDIR